MEPAKVLLVDDDKNLLRVLTYHIEEMGFEVNPISSARAALDLVRNENFDLVITDLRMPEMDGLELIRKIRDFDRELPIIVLTAYASIDKAVEAVKLGASDFISKPFEKAEIQHAISKALELADLLEENRRLSNAVTRRFEFRGFVGSSKRFQQLLDMASQLADVETTVLIQGESGTGKELIAQAIHYNSRRRGRPFVVVNCGAIPTDLIESELFGYRKGAFTGAASDRKGKFETADTGTIFLDEVGELPPSMQVKLLRVLQQKELDIVGDPHPRSVDIRVLAATNRDLRKLMNEGGFREDLFYRLSVAPLYLPPLRERREDISLLIHYFLDQLKEKLDKDISMSSEAVEELSRYPWPGNVRELENLLERLAVFDRSGRINAADLPPEFRNPDPTLSNFGWHLPEKGFSLEALERDILLAALNRHDWNQTHTARYLGITRNTLIYRMQKFELRKNDEPEHLDS